MCLSTQTSGLSLQHSSVVLFDFLWACSIFEPVVSVQVCVCLCVCVRERESERETQAKVSGSKNISLSRITSGQPVPL